MKAATATETTRERILRTAAELFARKGFHATGVAEIGEAAGVGKGALYHHIKSKEDLLYELTARHVQEGIAKAEEVLHSDASPDEKLRRLTRVQLRTVAESQAEITIFFREQNALTGQRRRKMSALRHRVEDVWREVLQEGVDQGVLRSADPVVVKGILGLINYSFLWFDPHGPLTPEQIADRLTDLVLRGELVRGAADEAAPLAAAAGSRS